MSHSHHSRWFHSFRLEFSGEKITPLLWALRMGYGGGGGGGGRQGLGWILVRQFGQAELHA